MKKKEGSNYKNFGLIGKDISYSFSPSYFREKFERHHILASYKLYNLKRIEEFPSLFLRQSFAGLNVTIPYKEVIINFMDRLSPEAEEIGAVNTIQFKGQQLIGHNTDYIGFQQSIQPMLNDKHQKALILGTGGATKAIQFALKELQIDFKTVSRKQKKGDLTYDKLTPSLIQEFHIVINATPVGTFPNTDQMPNIPMDGIGKDHIVYDLIYNPNKTKLLIEAERKGATIKNGLEMLEIQAEEAWKIWNS